MSQHGFRSSTALQIAYAESTTPLGRSGLVIDCQPRPYCLQGHRVFVEEDAPFQVSPAQTLAGEKYGGLHIANIKLQASQN
jgi:hypothetical protein